MIVSAHIARVDPQADGRQHVVEIQTDDTDGDQRFEYLANAGADLNAIMAARTAAINAWLASLRTI